MSHVSNDELRSPRLSLPDGSPDGLTILAEQHALEGLPKYFVEDGVEYGIDHRARVPEPGHKVEYLAVDLLLAIGTDRGHEVQDEKRGPEDHESEENDTEDFGGLLLEPDYLSPAGTVS